MSAWLIETTFAVTLLMLLVLAVRRPVAHFFGAGWAYALWLLPALRLVLPPLRLIEGMPSLMPPVAPATAMPAEAAAIAAAPGVELFAWEPMLLGLWAAGAAAFLLWQAWSYFAFLRRLGIGSQVHASLAQDIGIIESREVDGPIAIGLLDKWIVVPADFATRYTAEEQRLALRHERIHHQREDIFWNMVALAVLALNWFNPVAYAAFRAFRSDQELSCDAAVAAEASSADRHDYARALVKSASKPGLIAACPLNHAGQLKRRLKMMKAHRRSRLRALGGSGAVAALLLAGIGVTESPSVAAPEPAPVAAPVPEAPRAAVPAPQPEPRKAEPRAAPKPRKAAARAPATPAPVAAPIPVPVEVGEEIRVTPAIPAPAPTPAPSPAPAEVRLRPAQLFVIRQSGPAGELRLVRTHVRTVAEMPPEMKAKLDKLVVQHIHAARLRAAH